MSGSREGSAISAGEALGSFFSYQAMTGKESTIIEFLRKSAWLSGDVACHFLAAGEYNENYLVTDSSGSYVFRINHGTQLGLDDQIVYEFAVLEAVAPSGATPLPYRCAARAEGLGRGVLLMEYIAGAPLDYRRDLATAAGIFARIHALPADGRLLVQDNAARDIAAEAQGLLHRFDGPHYPAVRARLLDYHDEIAASAGTMAALYADEPLCIVNTEVNSGNFIIGGTRSCLVDWEKAVISHRYQDLAHFLAPTTTLWKSAHRLSPEEKRCFLSEYRKAGGLAMSLDEISGKTALMERVILLRALSWCYMAYHEYILAGRSLAHRDTFATITSYLQEAECFLA